MIGSSGLSCLFICHVISLGWLQAKHWPIIMSNSNIIMDNAYLCNIGDSTLSV